ncbi:MAG TPA: metallophosphoesterase family protein [Gemmatimonadaceae bacterium]|nr:metallophosphoesterase family protein [Gemmatimonadaceae bacterium]
MAADARVVGIISDTHGLLRSGVHEALAGVDVILHAGDVGGDEILSELQLIAPVRAVFGNTDPPGTALLEEAIELAIDGVAIHVSHGHELGSPTPARLAAAYPGADVIVYGHTHRQLITRIGDRLIVNPGAAGPRRFKLQPSLGRMTISGGKAEVEIIDLT